MFDVYKKMASRKDFADTIMEGIEAANGRTDQIGIVFQVATLQVLLDIRDIVDGLDKRMGAASIKKAAKKKK